MKHLLCKLGIHRPLTIKHALFNDAVSSKTVFSANCPCGKWWMTDSINKWFGFKADHKRKNKGD